MDLERGYTEGLLDPAHIRSLQTHLPESAMEELMAALAQDFGRKGDELSKADPSTPDAVARIAHDLKSAAGNAGAAALADAARALEHAARRGDGADLAAPIDRVLGLCNRTKAVIAPR